MTKTTLSSPKHWSVLLAQSLIPMKFRQNSKATETLNSTLNSETLPKLLKAQSTDLVFTSLSYEL